MKNKIAQRLTKYFVLALTFFAIIAGSLFSVMFARHTADVTKRDLCAHAVSIAQTIAHFTAECDQGECKGGGFKAYMRYIGDVAMSELYLLDAQGNSVILGEMEMPEEPLPPRALPLVGDVFKTGEVSNTGFSLNPFHAEDMFVCAPVISKQGDVTLALVMSASVNSVGHALQDAFYMLTACLAIAMAIAIIASGFLSRRFVTPLHRMMDAATMMAGGDYSAKTRVKQNDEIGVLAAHIDALADQLAEAERERSRFDQLRQDFFSDISHELRTPISVLKGSIELLRDESIDDLAQRRQYYDQLYAHAHHLQRMVNDLLELTRLQNIQFKIEMDVINVMDVLSDTIRFMRQKADEKRIAVRLDGDTAPFPVLGDYGRLRQLMIILLDNAIKFSKEDDEVSISVRRMQAACEVSVTDRGCGIDEEALEHIFDRYFYSHSGKNRSGTGLGLPIAREIALRHGMELSCRSKPGEGTCFTLVFHEHQMTDI